MLVLGEMRELGDLSSREHGELGEVAAAHRPALLIAVGGDAALIAERAAASGVEALFVEDATSAAELAADSGSEGVEQRCSGPGGAP